MCYEERYFSQWARKAARKREETPATPEHRQHRVEPAGSGAKREPAKPRETERELEIV